MQGQNRGSPDRRHDTPAFLLAAAVVMANVLAFGDGPVAAAAVFAQSLDTSA